MLKTAQQDIHHLLTLTLSLRLSQAASTSHRSTRKIFVCPARICSKHFSSAAFHNTTPKFCTVHRLLGLKEHSHLSSLFYQDVRAFSFCSVSQCSRQTLLTPCRHCGIRLQCSASDVSRSQFVSMATSTSEKAAEKNMVAISPDDEQMRKMIREIFMTAVESVMPRPMLEKVMTFDPTKRVLTVDGHSYQIDRNLFVVGFGKAVLGMARTVDDLLGEHIIKGIISIPTGARADYEKAGKMDMLLREGSKICVQEGATNNLPDHNAFVAARDIHKLISNLTTKDIIIVLMSGGGSALLPYPVEPLDMDDVLKTAQTLFRHGASIGEVNTVRKHMEVLKGGGLAKAAMPAQVVSLIMSDVIGDSLDLIASGPTVRSTYSAHRCLDVISHFSAEVDMPERVLSMLKARKSQLAVSARVTEDPRGGVIKTISDAETDWSRVQNVLVGTNTIACQAAAQHAEQLGFVSMVLSHELCGEAKQTGEVLAKLAEYVCACYHPRTSTTASSDLVMLELDVCSYGISKDKLNEVAVKASKAYNASKPMCVVAGGETTVRIAGSGKGGRSQEMALAAGIQLQKGFQVYKTRKPHARILFLSGGTDGQDGPTPAAGALVDENFMVDAACQGLKPQLFLDNNDSFTLWTQFAQARDLLVTGLTGTNVMDIQLLVVNN